MRKILEFLANESGGTTIEYALIAGIVSAGLIASFGAIGTKVGSKFIPVSNALN